MRRFLFFIFLGAGLCVATGAHCFAAEESVSGNDIQESVSGNDVLDSDHQDSITADDLLSILEGFDHSFDDELPDQDVMESVSVNDLDWDVMYFDYLDDDGNDVTTKFTQYQDGATLYMSQEDYPGGLQGFASYNTYYGLIGSQYLDLFRGLAVKIGINEHYVCSRVSQYEYIFAHGDLKLSGNHFTGNNISVINYHTNNNGYFSSGVESTFSLNAQNYIVYSDLGKNFPSLLENDDVYSRAVFFLVGIVVIGYFINSFFGKGVVTNNLRKSKKREVY